MNISFLPAFVPTASHPQARGGFTVGFQHPEGGSARVSLSGPRIGDIGADHVAARIGTLLAYGGAPWDSRTAVWHTLYAGDAGSEAVRAAALRANQLIRAAG